MSTENSLKQVQNPAGTIGDISSMIISVEKQLVGIDIVNWLASEEFTCNKL